MPPVFGWYGIELYEHFAQSTQCAMLLGGSDGILEDETTRPEQQVRDRQQDAQACNALGRVEVWREWAPSIRWPNEWTR